jgi:hypothetical protein
MKSIKNIHEKINKTFNEYNKIIIKIKLLLVKHLMKSIKIIIKNQ